MSAPSSSPQGNSPPPQPTPPTSFSSGHSELTPDGGRAFSQLAQTAKHGRMSAKTGKVPTILQGMAAIQLGPANFLNPLGQLAVAHAAQEGEHETDDTNDSKSVASGRSSKFGFKKHVSRLFKGEAKPKDAVATSAATPPPMGPTQRVEAALPDVKVTPVSLDPHSSAQSGGTATNARSSAQVASAAASAPIIQLQSSSSLPGPLRLDIFPKIVARPVLSTDLPKPRARIEKTSQLIHCYSLFGRVQTSSSSSASGTSDDSQPTPLNGKQQEWVDQIDPIEQDHLRWLITQLVKEFSEDTIKGSAAIAEIVLVGPVLDRVSYRALLSCFISKFEQTTPLDLSLLEGLVQLVECASSGHLVDNDLVRIATVLSKELEITHNGTNDHPSHLTWALSRVFDVMVAGKVKDLNRDRDHQPMLQLLAGLKESDSTYLKYQAAYAYQALQYSPDDETPLQALWRYTQIAAAGASSVASVFKLDPLGFLEGMEHLQQIGGGVADVIKAGIEGVKAGIEGGKALREGAQRLAKRAENNSDFMEKRSWYLALQGTALFIRQGRLSDFNQVVTQAPCRRDVNFQWGICRQLGEIAVDPLWDVAVRQQAIDFLGELYRNNTDWKPHVDIKQWILTILVRISELSDPATKDRAHALLEDFKKDGNTEFPGSFPLSIRLPLPVSFLLLAKVQEIPKVEYALHTLRTRRLSDYKQAVYIPPLAKPSLQAGDGTLSPLMENVQDFLTGVGQVMLILGDSGAGKSTFNRHLENELWKGYQTGGRIPLFINLPALERPEKELIAEQLRIHRFTEAQIMELEQHRQFTLICDGYDESQLTSNLHTKNALNQSGQRDTKMIITCRTQYLGPDYRDRFVPKSVGQYHRAANDIFQEAVIAPFSKSQIEDYVERYVPLEPRTWVKEDYMDKLTTIPNLMDLVKNPFLLTIALEALPSVIQGKGDLSKVRVTRVELYDNFVEHWLGVNKRRLQDQKLDGTNRIALEVLLIDGFERNGVLYQKELATAIFKEQEGRPVIDYSHMRDRQTWKVRFFGLDPERALLRDSSLLGRAGTQYRFVHRSVLEYFYSCTICEPAEFGPQAHFNPTITLQPIADHPLSQRNLIVEPSIVQFLAERVQLSSAFKQHLHAIIELSKADDQASQAAANAITILVRAGVRFNGANLRSIRVPGADLSGGQFDSAQLQDADLTGVNLTRSWIRMADLSNASMEGVQFGELPYLKEDVQVNCCVFSPDGHTLADGLSNGDINIYDTATWARVRTLQGHEDGVSSLAYSPSGHQLLSGSYDETVRLWNCKTGVSERVMEEHSDSVVAVVVAVAFSPSGKQFASASKDRSVKLWNAQTGAVAFDLGGDFPEYDIISSVTFSPNGEKVAAGSYNGEIRSFDTQTGVSELVLHAGRGINSLAYSPDGHRIVSGDAGSGLQLWDAVTGKSGRKWTTNSGYTTSVTFSPDGQLIASSGGDNVLRLWDAQATTLVSIFAGHSQPIEGVAFSPDGLQLASCSRDRTVRLWETNSTRSSLDSHDLSDRITCLAYSPDGRSLSTGSCSGMRLYDAATGELDPILSRDLRGVQYVGYSPVGLHIAALDDLSYSSPARIWNVEADTLEFELHGNEGLLSAIAFSPCGNWIGTSNYYDDDNIVRLWNARLSGILAHDFTGHIALVTSLVFSPTGLQLISGGFEGTIRIWEVETRECRVFECGGLSDDVRSVMYSPNGLQILTSFRNANNLQIWDEQTEELQHTLEHDHDVICMAFSSCDQWIATGCGSSVWLWTLTSSDIQPEWRCAAVVRDFFGDVKVIAWKPEALEFATGCGDGSFRVWRLQDEMGGLSIRLVWGSGPTALVVSDATISNTIGLSPINQKLLTQRGAIDGSSSLDSE